MPSPIKKLMYVGTLSLSFTFLADAAAASGVGFSLLDLGLEGLKEYVSEPASPCRAVASGSLANTDTGIKVLSAAAGGVLGASLGGSLESILTGTSVAYAAADVGTETMHRYQSVVARRREDVCEKLRAGRSLVEPMVADVIERLPPDCRVGSTNIEGQLREIEACAETEPSVGKELEELKSSVYAVNHQTCLAVLSYLNRWNREQAKRARVEESTFLPAMDAHASTDGYSCR